MDQSLEPLDLSWDTLEAITVLRDGIEAATAALEAAAEAAHYLSFRSSGLAPAIRQGCQYAEAELQASVKMALRARFGELSLLIAETDLARRTAASVCVAVPLDI